MRRPIVSRGSVRCQCWLDFTRCSCGFESMLACHDVAVELRHGCPDVALTACSPKLRDELEASLEAQRVLGAEVSRYGYVDFIGAVDRFVASVEIDLYRHRKGKGRGDCPDLLRRAVKCSLEQEVALSGFLRGIRLGKVLNFHGAASEKTQLSEAANAAMPGQLLRVSEAALAAMPDRLVHEGTEYDVRVANEAAFGGGPRESYMCGTRAVTTSGSAQISERRQLEAVGGALQTDLSIDVTVALHEVTDLLL